MVKVKFLNFYSYSETLYYTFLTTKIVHIQNFGFLQTSSSLMVAIGAIFRYYNILHHGEDRAFLSRINSRQSRDYPIDFLK